MRPGLHCNRASRCRHRRQFETSSRSASMRGSRPRASTLAANASAERQKQSSANTISSGQGFGGSTFNTFQTGLTASYMLDFWGKNRATLYAAEENATVSRYNREVVTLTTEVTVANTYF